MGKFGKLRDDGSAESEPTECALSGIAVSTQDGSVREKVTGTPYFYRIHGSQYENMTDDIRALLAQQAKENPDAKWEPLDLSKLKRVEVRTFASPVIKPSKAKEGVEQ